MALTVQPPAPPGWSRWPQHHPNGDYVIMDPAITSYDSRPTTSAPVERPVVAQNFFPGHAFTTASMPSMTTPQFLPGLPPVTYTGYSSYTTSPIFGSFKQEQYPDRPQLRIISPGADVARTTRDPRESMSPSIKSESQASRTMSIASTHSTSPGTVSSTPANGASSGVPSTRVDALMKVIQAKSEITPTPENRSQASGQDSQLWDIKMELGSQTSLPPHPGLQRSPRTTQKASSTSPRNTKPKTKRYACNFAGCGKTFGQKTHLDTHIRSHTGEKPYVCAYGCGKCFSQVGNQKMHERRHTGEKPFKCEKCDKTFHQLGTLVAHGISHSKAKPYACKLDNCNKKFTQRGNLKSHQEKFHGPTLEALIKKWAMSQLSEVPEEERELLEYFAHLYKNSNKGIKGRGKHHKVKRLTQIQPPILSYPVPPHSHGLPQILNTTPQPLHHHVVPHHHGSMSHLSAFSLSRPQLMVHTGSSRDTTNGHYGMFETEDDCVSGSGSSSTVYDGDHGREQLSFRDRMY